MVKKTLSRYALAPWGMQPNTLTNFEFYYCLS